MKLREHLISYGRKLGLEGKDQNFIDFFKMIMENNFQRDELCVKKVLGDS